MSERRLRAALLRWYDRAARALPWRGTRDPYAIWVSEIMLQQTRVETVERYYRRFLDRFPTPQALAHADQDAVMALWSGLGYYRRARLLHRGVREVVARYGGQVPRDAAARRALPGVGRYTAGAIGSIAFDHPEPIVDGNVARVLSRLYAIEAPLGSAQSERALWRRAEELVAGPRPGDFNQALMELGATVCTKRVPRCQACPLSRHCQARTQDRTSELPVARPKKAPVPVDYVALLATRGRGRRRELVLHRGQGSLFGGLWNLPMVEGRGLAAARQLLGAIPVRGQLRAESCGEVRHVLSHRALRVRLYSVARAVCLETHADLRSFPVVELGALGVSRLTRKALEAGLGTSSS